MRREAKLRKFLMDDFLPGTHRWLDDDTPLGESGIIDGAAWHHLVEYIGEEYSIVVHDHEVTPDNLGSLGSILAFVDRKRFRVPVGITL